MRRWCRYLAGGLFGVGVSLFALDQAAPPPLVRFEDRSLVVADRSGAPLRIFQSADDKWRLLTRPADVDPLYLAMLKAYEDKRFDRHWGVDPLAIGAGYWAGGRSGTNRFRRIDTNDAGCKTAVAKTPNAVG